MRGYEQPDTTRTNSAQAGTNPTCRVMARAMATGRARKNRLLLALAASAVVGAVGRSSFGAVASEAWVGNFSTNFLDGNWYLSANTTNTTFNNPPLATDSLNFNAASYNGTALNNNLALNTSIGSTSYANAFLFNAGASPYTITGNTIFLTSNITNNSTSLETINLPMILTTTALATRTISPGAGGINLGGVISQNTTSGSLATAGFTGTLTLSGANTYNGSNTVAVGTTMALNFAAAGAPVSNILLPTGGAFILGGGNLNINSANGGNNAQTLASLSVTSGASNITMINNGATTDALTFTSATIARSAGGTVDFISPANTSISVAATTVAYIGTYAFYGSGTSETYAATTSGLVGAATLTSASSGAASLTSATTNYAYVSPGSPDIMTGNATANSVDFSTAGAQTIDLGTTGSNTLALNGLLNTNGALTIQTTSGTGTVVIGANKELVIGGPSNITIAAPIMNNGSNASALTYSGGGILTLSALNTYTSTTTINSGTVALGISGAINSATTNTVVINSGATLAMGTFNDSVGTINLNGGSITGSGTLSVTNTSNAAITLQSGTVSAILAGVGGLTKSSTATVTLSQNNLYTGPTTISAGTLQVSSDSNLGASALGTVTATAADILLSGGTLQITANNFSTNKSIGLVSATALTDVIDIGSTTGANFSGGIAGTANSHVLVLNAGPGGVGTYSGPMNSSPGTFTVLKSGAGTWKLTSTTSTNTGTVTVNNGILENDGVLPTNQGNITLTANPSASIIGLAGSGNWGSAASLNSVTSLGNAFASPTFNFSSSAIFNGKLQFQVTSGQSMYEANNWTGQGTANGLVGSTALLTIPLSIEVSAGQFVIGHNTTLTSTNYVQIDNGGTWGSIYAADSTATLAGSLYYTSRVADSFVGKIIDANASDPTSIIIGVTPSNMPGGMIFTGANTYTGQTTISAGFLSASSLNSVNGGTPLLAASSLGAPTTVANGTISLGSNSGQNPGGVGVLIYTGTGETTDRVIDLGGVTNGGTLDQSGTGLLKFTSPFTASVGGTKTLTLQGSTSGTGEVANTIVDSGGGATSVTKAGSGTWTLSGANSYTGTTSVNGGTLIVNANAGGSLNPSSPLLLGGGTLKLLGQTAGTTSQTMGAVTFAAGTASTVTVDGGSSVNTTLNLGNFTDAPGSAVNLTTVNGGNVTTTQANTSGILSGRITFNGTDFAVGNGASAVTAASYTALATTGTSDTNNSIATGNVSFAAGPFVQTTNSLKVTTNGSGQSLVIGSGNTLALTSGGLLFTGANNYNITGGTLQSGTATNSDLIIHHYGAGILTIGSVIANGNGASTLTKAGPGTLNLTASNTYTGGTYLDSGTLIAGNTSALGNSAGLLQIAGGTLDLATDSSITAYNTNLTGNATILSDKATSATAGITHTLGTFNMSGSTLTVAPGANVTGGAPALAFGATTIVGEVPATFNAAGASITLASLSIDFNSLNVLGSGGSTVSVAGTTTLANAFSGVAGAITNFIPTSANLSLTTLTSLAIGRFQQAVFDGTSTGNTITGQINNGTANGTVSIIKSNTSTWTLSGANINTGPTTILGGTLKYAKEVSLYNYNASLWTPLVIRVDPGAIMALNVGGTGEFTSSDVGTLAALGTGDSGFRSGSTLALDTTNAAGGNFVLSGILPNPNSGANVLNIIKLGANTLTLNNQNTYTGTMTISSGALQVGNGSNTGTLGSGPVVNNTTLSFNRSDAALNVSSAISGPGTVNQIGIGTTTLSGLNSYTGATNVNFGTLGVAAAGALPLANPGMSFFGSSLNISAGASVVATHLVTPTALQVSSLANGGLIDLNNNALDVHTGTLTTIYSQIQTGYNGGSWNGTSGIISSDARNNAAHLTALGAIVNHNGVGPLYGSGGSIASTFEGVTPSDGDVLVKYTYYGDTNLDGKVDGTDYSRIDASYFANQGSPGSHTGWFNGDFNYDNTINGSDYTLIDNAYNSQGAILSAEIATPTAQIAGGASSSVPEPASLGLLGIGVAGLLGRRGGSRRRPH